MYFLFLPQKVMAERGARLLFFFASLIVLRFGGADKGKFRLSIVINVTTWTPLRAQRGIGKSNDNVQHLLICFYQLIAPTLIFTLMFNHSALHSLVTVVVFCGLMVTSGLVEA